MDQLPPSLPSYAPEEEKEEQGRGKRQAPVGQWITPPHYLFSTRQSNGIPPSVATNTVMTSELFKQKTGIVMNLEILAKMLGKKTFELDYNAIQGIVDRPDMLSIYEKLIQEEERRSKRLERNRNSARARREKKKNRIEMNEMMVSKLEAKKVTMEGLTWGNGETMRHKDLLCMDNSYTSYSTEQKMDLLKTVLKNIAMAAHELERQQWDAAILAKMAMDAKSGKEQLGMVKVLMDTLQLSDVQLEQLEAMGPIIAKKCSGQTIARKCIAAMEKSDWLTFPEVEHLVKECNKVFEKKQVLKLSNWATQNSIVIDEAENAQEQDNGVNMNFSFED